MLVAWLEEQMLNEQPDVVEHAVPDHAVVVQSRLQTRDGGALAAATALRLDRRRRRVPLLVDLQQKTVELSAVNVHADDGRKGEEGVRTGLATNSCCSNTW